MKTRQVHSMGKKIGGGGVSGAFNAAAGNAASTNIKAAIVLAILDDALDSLSYTVSGGINALEHSSLGRPLNALRIKKHIDYHPSSALPDDTLARYVYEAGTRNPGKIEYKDHPLPQHFGHELRHAWQQMELPEDVLNPVSPDEAILLNRFKEGDAAAVELGIAVQLIYFLRYCSSFETDKRIANKIFTGLSQDQKSIIGSKIDAVIALHNSSDNLKQAMRRAFDLAIAHMPASKGYRKQAEEHLGAPATGAKHRIRGLARLFFKRPSKQSGHIRFSRRGIDPAYVQKLVNALGFMGEEMPGNYLTDTKGPAFNSRFYTGTGDFRLERHADAMGVGAR